MPPRPVKKALKVEEFLPLDDILETSSKWKAWRRKIEIQMDYFDITDPNITFVIDLIKQEKSGSDNSTIRDRITSSG